MDFGGAPSARAQKGLWVGTKMIRWFVYWEYIGPNLNRVLKGDKKGTRPKTCALDAVPVHPKGFLLLSFLTGEFDGIEVGLYFEDGGIIGYHKIYKP